MPTRPGTTDNARARNRRRLLVLLLAIFTVWCAAVVCVFAVLLDMAEDVKEANRTAASVERATAGREGEAWTLNELFSYLEAKGVVASMQVVETGRDELPAEWLFKTADKRTVRVKRLPTPEAAAKDAEDNRKARGFSWGRFSFVGDPTAMASFRPVLHD